MKIKLFTSDQSGCGFYRMIAPGRAVAAKFPEHEIVWIHEEDDDEALRIQTAGRIANQQVTAVADPECDVIVFQRPAHKHMIEAIPYIQAWGTAVVCDYDDDFNSIDRSNAAYLAYEPHANPMMNKLWAQLGSQLCDLVTVTTPALGKSYGSHGRVAVLPNCVPESYLQVKPSWNGTYLESWTGQLLPRIGWAGTPRSHPGDLQMMGSSIKNLSQNGRAVFRTIGDVKTPVSIGLTADDSEVLEWAPLDEFMAQVASFEVGVVPLRDSKFNRAKSWLKGLEYAALGVPFVASPTAEYKRLAEYGAGDVVSMTTPSTSAWERALLRYIDDPGYAALRSEEGRIVASQWTYEKRAETWLQAWGDAVSMRRAQ